mmetsp:Transcript_243/g.543  ORF Transcript_243/g.543 Transcript_243/m.543 type:complete len:385 (-) Transcript_243:391-1545(-)
MPAEPGKKKESMSQQAKREMSMQATSSKRESSTQPTSSSRPKPPAKIANGRFEIDKRLGAGCFGEVYRGMNVDTKQEVAVKFEDLQARTQQLEQEAAIMSLLRQPLQPQGFSECFYFGREGRYNCLVMELLGKSLEDCVQERKGRFTPLTSAMVADQLIRRVEYLHSKGIVHRDIKPENFMWGTKGKIHHLYMIDFGLSKRFYDKSHVMMRDKLSLTGTARYASINAHRGVEQSRRDDLEAIGHMLLYFLRGVLPWSGLDAKNKEEKYRKIREKKEDTPLGTLCAGFPDEFQTYLQYTRNLDFQERPDYNMLRKLFADVRERLGPVEDHELEWLQHANLDPRNLVPLNPWTPPRQPDDVDSKSNGGGGFRRAFCFCGGKAPRND